MSTNIQLLRSSVLQKRPDPASLLDGQAAVNIHVTEPGLFFKATDGDLFKVGPVAVNVSGNAPNAAPAGTTGNTIGETWLDGRAAYANPVMKVFNGTVWAPSSGFAVNDITGDFTLTKLLTIRTLDVNGTGANSYARMPQGPTTDQSLISGAAGMFRFDSTTEWFKGHDGTDWYGFAKEGDNATFINLTVEGNADLGQNCATDTVDIRGVLTLHCDGTLGASSSNSLAIISEAERRGSNMTFTNQGELRFSPSVMGSTYVGFEAPNSVPSSVTWKLPNADGTSEQALVTDGAGNLTWESIQGGAFVSENPPSNPDQGDLWYDCNQGRLFVYYDDGNSVQWVDTNPAGSGAGLWEADGVAGINPTSAANVNPNSNGGNSLGESTKRYLQSSGRSSADIFSAQPTSWPVGGALKYPGGAAPVISSYPAVFPFYVVDANNVLLGYATEGVN